MPGFNHKKSFNFPLNGEDESILRIVFKANEETALGPWVHTVAAGNNLHLPNILQQKTGGEIGCLQVWRLRRWGVVLLMVRGGETHRGIFFWTFFSGGWAADVFWLFLCVFQKGRKWWRVFFVGNVWFIAGSVQVWWKNYTNNFNRSPERHRTSWKHEIEDRKNISGRYWYSYNKYASCFAGNYYGVGK